MKIFFDGRKIFNQLIHVLDAVVGRRSEATRVFRVKRIEAFQDKVGMFDIFGEDQGFADLVPALDMNPFAHQILNDRIHRVIVKQEFILIITDLGGIWKPD